MLICILHKFSPNFTALFWQGFKETISEFNKFGEVPEEPHGTPAEAAAGHHQWAWQPY
jgi:hypothetical protein